MTVSWTDGNDNQVDDITHTFELGITPIEAQSPDFDVIELLWSPVNPTVGTEVTLTAKISNLVNNTQIFNNPKCLLIQKKGQKISRNEKCEATGKKFKHCCGSL